ncbi:MAG: site-specific integrase [Deltaproteobacteria bacterium]|nr:site-specific integrase [Deltaproteobacteria bacterium]
MGVKVRQKTKGRGKPWWVFIAHKGRRASKKVGDKDAAEEVASTIRAQIQLGVYSFEEEKPTPTFKEYADSWIKTTVPATCKPSTAKDYGDLLRIHILPVFGDTRITDITRGKIKDFLLEKVNEGYAGSTVAHMKNTISGVLNKALDDEVIPANTAHRLGKIIKIRNHDEKLDPLTQDELKKLLDIVQQEESLSPWYPMCLLLSRTGMRIGEAMALRWGDIDFNGRFIHVQRGVSRGRIELPKNGKTRKVDMSKQLTETLKAHQTESKKKGLALGLGDAPEYVFTNENGGLIDNNNWRKRVFDKALKKAGLRGIRIHDLRHTYATLRISKGDNIQDVSNQLGHYSVKLTLDVYSHWIPGKKKDEVDALDDAEYALESEKAGNEA